MRPITKPTLIAILLAASLPCLMAGCGNSEAAMAPGDEDDSSGSQAEDQGVPVEVDTVVRGSISRYLRLTGTLEARRTAKVPCRVDGRVARIEVEVGDLVTVDAVLARLETDDVDIDRAEIEGEHNLALQVVRQREIALAEAMSRHEQAREEETKARADKDRQEVLAQRGMITEETLENSRSEHQKKTLDVQAAGLAVDRASVEVEIERARAANLDATRARMVLRHSRHTLTSPQAGVITSVAVKDHDAVSPGQVLFTVMDQSLLELHLRVPESSISQLRNNSQATLTTESSPDAEFRGTVTLISPVVDPSSGTMEVVVTVDSGGTALRPGLFVGCAIETEKHIDVLLAPKRSLIYDEGMPVLFVVDADSKAVRIPLRGHRGLDSNMQVEVDHPALVEGTRVIVLGQANLKDGSTVGVVEPVD